jgi:hypothetical protein
MRLTVAKRCVVEGHKRIDLLRHLQGDTNT